MSYSFKTSCLKKVKNSVTVFSSWGIVLSVYFVNKVVKIKHKIAERAIAAKLLLKLLKF